MRIQKTKPSCWLWRVPARAVAYHNCSKFSQEVSIAPGMLL